MSVTDRSHTELHEQAADEPPGVTRTPPPNASRSRPARRSAGGSPSPRTLAVRADRIAGRGGLSHSAVVADIHREAMNLRCGSSRPSRRRGIRATVAPALTPRGRMGPRRPDPPGLTRTLSSPESPA